MRENNTWISEDRDGFLIQDFPPKTAVCSKNYKSLISSSSSSGIPLCIHSGLDKSTFCIWNSGIAVSGAEQRSLAAGVHPDPEVQGLEEGPWKWSSQSWTIQRIDPPARLLIGKRDRGFMGLKLLDETITARQKNFVPGPKPCVFGWNENAMQWEHKSRAQASLSLHPTPFWQ